MTAIKISCFFISILFSLNTFAFKGKDSCDLSPNAIDSYVLALSFQPGFCKVHGDSKKECRHIRDDAYLSHHFSLHGLWPNQDACGIHYGFCNAQPKDQFCDYAPLILNEMASKQLGDVMLSYRYQTCLERHEWNKHGTCQERTPDDYFLLATHFVNEMNASLLGDYIANHVGEMVKLKALQDVVSQQFGKNASHNILFHCQGAILTEVTVGLPDTLSETNSLVELVQQATPNKTKKNTCPSRVMIVKL